MKHLYRWVLLLGLVVLLSGCGGSRESQLIGVWKVRPGSIIAGALTGATAPGASAGAALGLAMMSIAIRADKTFTLTSGAAMEGTWTFDEDSGTATLTVNTANGKDLATAFQSTTPVHLNYTAQLDSDNTMLTLKNTAPHPTADALPELNFEKR